MNTAATQSFGIEQPLYLTVYEALRDALLDNTWTIGASLPSEADLSDRFKVSRITVRHALRLLETDGYIRKARAKRPVVVRTAASRNSGWLLESIEDIVTMVGDAQLKVQTWRRETSQPDATLLGLPGASMLHCLRSVLVRDGKPYARSIIYFPPQIGSRLRRNAFDDAVVFRVLHRELGIHLDDVRLTVWAEPANPQDVASLACRRGAPLLVTQLLYTNTTGAPVELAYSRSLASAARLSTRLRSSHSVP
jgi:GntR family transcriptional regulator